MEDQPTNGELALMIGSLSEHIVEIKEQVIKTNGRVGVLENWRSTVLGGLLVTNVILLPTAITLIVKYLTK